jgi:uncharacterized protein DUF6884
MPQRIGLVAASRQQRGVVCRARDQYDASVVFRRARDYCERTYEALYILSPTHGLLPAEQVIGPDPFPLAALDADARWLWADTVSQQLRALCERAAQPPTFYLYAGRRISTALLRAAPFARVERPLSGLSLGEQLRWYHDHLRFTSRIPLVSH